MIAIYARQSVEKKDSISIETQIEFCKKRIEDGNEPLIFQDRGFSGKNTDRPAFQKMLSQIEAGNINKVIVYKLDRISRSVIDFATMYRFFEKCNVEFYSCNEQFDTSTPIGKAMLSITVVFAELERETIQKRVSDNYYGRAKRGFFGGGPTPYGYNKVKTEIDNKRTSSFIIDEDQSRIVRYMYDLYANTSNSLGSISSLLNNQNVPAPNGGRWDSCKLSRIMRNPVYVKSDVDVYEYYKKRGVKITNEVIDFIGTNGCFLYGKREANERKYTNVTDHFLSLCTHEGIVYSDIWLKCQVKLDGNKQIKNTGKGKHTWLSGLTKCIKCGYTMTVTTSGSYKYFICRGKTNLQICDSKVIAFKNVEQIVKSEMDKYIVNFDQKIEKRHMINNVGNNKLRAKIMEIEEQIQSILDNLDGVSSVTMKYIDQKIAKLDAERKKLVDELETIQTYVPDTPFNEIKECLDNWEDASFEQKKAVAVALIKRVRLGDGEIEIIWNV